MKAGRRVGRSPAGWPVEVRREAVRLGDARQGDTAADGSRYGTGEGRQSWNGRRPPDVERATATKCVKIKFNLSQHVEECVKIIRVYNSHKIRQVSLISA